MGVGLEEAAAHFAAAPFDAARWDAAVDGLANATGGWAGQLGATSVSRGWLLDITPRMPKDGLAELYTWGLDPAEMPRAKMFHAPLMRVCADYDFISEDERLRSPFYHFLERFDCHRAGLARVDQFDDVSIMAISNRHEAAGHIQAAELETFAALLPHVRAAVRLQLRLEDQGARLAVGMMEAVRSPALVCDGAGRLAAASPAGEARLAAGGALTVRGGRLYCPDPASNAALTAAIARAGVGPVARGQPFPSDVRLRHPGRGAGLRAEVAPIPPALATFRLRASVMVLLHPETASEAPEARLMRRHGLTRAEAEVALALAAGQSPSAISDARGVRLSTVRSQIDTIFAKTGLNRQAELVALVLRTNG